MKSDDLSGLLHHLGLEPKAEFVGQGVSARVWRVQKRGETFALRVTRGDTDEDPRMAADYGVRRALKGTTARVAAAVHVGVWNGLEYALDEFVIGAMPTELSRDACVQLGWDKTTWLLEGYGRSVWRSAGLFCVILCLHHLNRSAQHPARQQKALERLSDTLERLRLSA